MRVAVAGARGFVGRRLATHMATNGNDVVALGRHAESLPQGSHVEPIGVDVSDTDALAKALQDVEVAYYLVHSMAGGAGYAERDRDLARSFANASAAAGVRRV